MTKHVDIVGMGPGSLDYLTLKGLQALCQADLLVGSQRMLDSLDVRPGQRGVLAGGCNICARRVASVRAQDIVRLIDAEPAGSCIAVLMSGDTGMFSGARSLGQTLAAVNGVELDYIPGISSASLLAARLQQPWQDWHFASLHGQDCNLLALVRQHLPLFLVTDLEHSPSWIARELLAADPSWETSLTLSIGEQLSYTGEAVRTLSLTEAAELTYTQPCVLVIQRSGSESAFAGASGTAGQVGADTQDIWPYATQGIPDTLFERAPKIPMSKQEVRAVALAQLRIASTDTVYDVGSGTGSVTVEAALLAREGQVFAVDCNEAACGLTSRQAQRFAATNVEVVQGTAPDALADLPAPDAVFVGGSSGNLQEILGCVRAKNPLVRICVTSVTLEALTGTLSLFQDPGWTDINFMQLAASHMEPLGSYHMMRAHNPIFIVSAQGSGAGQGTSGDPGQNQSQNQDPGQSQDPGQRPAS